jgi:hypothetical protein
MGNARYDAAACQWNQFLKDFCASEESSAYFHKLKVASILWRTARDSAKHKVYSRKLLDACADKVQEYRKADGATER